MDKKEAILVRHVLFFRDNGLVRRATGHTALRVLPIGEKEAVYCHMATIATVPRNAHSVAIEISDVETRAMPRAFFKLVERWGLNDRQGRILLGDPAARTYARWKAGQVEPSRISRDTRERLSILMGIHKSLRDMFPEPSPGYRWPRALNRAFVGAPALDRLLAGLIHDLAAVRAWLDAERGGW